MSKTVERSRDSLETYRYRKSRVIEEGGEGGKEGRKGGKDSGGVMRGGAGW